MNEPGSPYRDWWLYDACEPGTFVIVQIGRLAHPMICSWTRSTERACTVAICASLVRISPTASTPTNEATPSNGPVRAGALV
jgi:hypothetical protein